MSKLSEKVLFLVEATGKLRVGHPLLAVGGPPITQWSAWLAVSSNFGFEDVDAATDVLRRYRMHDGVLTDVCILNAASVICTQATWRSEIATVPNPVGG